MCVFHPGETSCPCTSIACSNFSFHGIEIFSLLVGHGNFAELRQGVCINGLNLVLWLSSLPLNSSEGSHEGLRAESCWEFQRAWNRDGWFSAGDPARGSVWCTHTLPSSLAKCTPCTQKARGGSLSSTRPPNSCLKSMLSYYLIICILCGRP